MYYILSLCGPVRCPQHVWPERALQKSVEWRRQALHKWLSHALKGGAGPAHRWCAKESALPDLPLVIRDSQGVFTADPQCVAEHYAREWKREWGCEDTFRFSPRITKHPCATRNTLRRCWRVGHRTRPECCKYSHSVSLCSSQKGDRPRPKLFPGHCPTFRHRLVLAGRNCQAELCQMSHANSVALAIAGFVGQKKRR